MRTTSRKIVVGYDGSDLADLALRWAVDTAALRHDPVEVLVASSLPPSVAAWTPVDGSYAEGMRQIADQAEKRLAELGSDATVHLRDDDVISMLVAAGVDAGMLVVGASGHNLLSAGLIGSVSRHLATYAPCPVVVVRPHAAAELADRPSRIVVGVESGPSSLPALRFALERADLLGVPVTALHAIAVDGLHAGGVGLPMRLDVDLTTAERGLAELLAGVEADFPGVEVTREVVPMRPERALVDAAESASLLVVGARGRNPFARLLLGSVSQQVLHHAHCPVAVVR